MGGAVGHLMHLHDDLDLRFEDIIDILEDASRGQLENVTEKFDGLNLVFSWDIESDSLRVARSAGDIKRGGLDATSLATKFFGRGDLATAFNSAFELISGAVLPLSSQTKSDVFGRGTRFWYSMEIISKQNPNVIAYDHDAIVLHAWPTFDVDHAGQPTMINDPERSNKLISALTPRHVGSWKILGPSMMKRKSRIDTNDLDRATSSIISEMMKWDLNPGSTLRDYVKVQLKLEVDMMKLPQQIRSMIIDRCMGDHGSPTLVDIKKNSNKSDHGTIIEFVKASEKHLKRYVRPIEIAVGDFAESLLRGYTSSLIDDPIAEVVRIREETQRAISAIESCNDETARQILQAQMQKLKSSSRVTTSIEGIVFIRGGNAYKFTGSFAPMSQILGLFKYGRGGVKLQMDSCR